MFDLSNFAENLSSLMSEHHLKAPALAKLLKTDRSNITRYLRGERLPTFRNFIIILEFFNVSADVLLGLTDYAQETNYYPLPLFGERLGAVMQETNTTQYALEHELHISGSCVYHWLKNQSLPSVENLVKLATFMDISVDYLLGRVH